MLKKAQRTKSHSITHANFFMHILIYGGRQGNTSIPKFYPRFSSPKLLFRLIIGRYIDWIRKIIIQKCNGKTRWTSIHIKSTPSLIFRPIIRYAALAIFGKTARRSTSQNKLAKEMKRILRSVEGRFFFLVMWNWKKNLCKRSKSFSHKRWDRESPDFFPNSKKK